MLKLFRKLLYCFNTIRWKIFKPTTIGVRVLLIKDELVVLVKHSYQNQWYIPGGGVVKGETIDEAVYREIKEEINGTINSMELFGVYTNFYEGKNDHIVVFESHSFTVGSKNSGEIEGIEFFPIKALPKKISPGSKRRIEEYKKEKRGHRGRW